MIRGTDSPNMARKLNQKLNLTPKSAKAKMRGHKVRNVVVEREQDGKMFVKFEGWNYWTWIEKKKDLNYTVKKGWVSTEPGQD